MFAREGIKAILTQSFYISKSFSSFDQKRDPERMEPFE
jgi:hypothetical protein